jgi:hypothetical protein
MYEGMELPAQVFVADPHAQAEATETRVIHVAGERRADASDPPGAELLTADGDHIQLTLGRWRAAHGTFTDDGMRFEARFGGLVVFGHYALFTQGPEDGAPLVPIDGAGIRDAFDADDAGNATFALGRTAPFGPGTRIYCIFASDGEEHRTAPGDLSRTTHIQLVATIDA